MSASKAIYTLSDFHVGDTVYLLPVNNKAYMLHTAEEIISHIEERVVTKVGRKYVTVDNSWTEKSFMYHDGYVGFRQVSDYSPDYELYKSKEDIISKLHREENICFLRNYNFDFLSNEALKNIRELIDKEENKDGTCNENHRETL